VLRSEGRHEFGILTVIPGEASAEHLWNSLSPVDIDAPDGGNLTQRAPSEGLPDTTALGCGQWFLPRGFLPIRVR